MTAARIVFSTGSPHVMDTAACFELAAETGFDGIEILCDDRWITRGPVYLRTLSTRYYVPILVVHAAIGLRLPGWQAPHDELQRIRHSLKAETLVVHLPQKVGLVVV